VKKQTKDTIEEVMAKKFFEALECIDIRNASGKGKNIKIPDTLDYIINQNIKEIEKQLKIKINFTTYILLCTIVMSQLGQNGKNEFYRLQNKLDLVDYAKDNSDELKVRWAEIILTDKKRSR
jgi:hypothetical protein